ncbi:MULTISPECIES: DUF2829 domain-containing protein [unclassified Paraburkholderia]|uniref:DUF2829 domain-containing protein n=1 Tax=unclassified Paraburkholderia TaxID=2615204 RepID=UPI002AB232C9|nr:MULTISPECIES: DUF2829 domain-containing protein [unclassified Paraburkholderia]
MTKDYIGTKIITAWPELRDGRDGYAVKYSDGYTSWSPADTFEDAYRAIEGVAQALTFGDALVLLKAGKKLARRGWNGQGMFVFLVSGSTFRVNRAPLLGIYPEGTEINYRPHLDLRAADGSIATWAPSGSDALANDWMVVE